MIKNENKVHLRGKVIEDLKYNHTTLGEMFFKMTVGVQRLSGAIDKIPVIISERVPGIISIQDQGMIEIEGSFRSRNEVVDGRSKLNLYVFAESVTDELTEGAPNIVNFSGYLCKKPILRTPPTGIIIADLIVAVNRGNGRSDYIPCIAWGRNATFVESLNVSDCVHIQGRLQSRDFQKNIDGVVENKTAYEVSVISIQVKSNEEE